MTFKIFRSQMGKKFDIDVNFASESLRRGSQLTPSGLLEDTPSFLTFTDINRPPSMEIVRKRSVDSSAWGSIPNLRIDGRTRVVVGSNPPRGDREQHEPRTSSFPTPGTLGSFPICVAGQRRQRLDTRAHVPRAACPRCCSLFIRESRLVELRDTAFPSTIIYVSDDID